jgi:adenine-specific DNA methylase
MFRKVAREQMIKWATNHLKMLSEDSFSRFVDISKDERKLDDMLELRSALFDFIADFANWDNSTIPEYLETSRLLTQAAHECLGGEQGTRPLVVDPFAGGGAIPFESLRLGINAFASDLNPVSVLLNKIQMEYIPKFGNKVAKELKIWGTKIQERAKMKIPNLYPMDPLGTTPIAYLWARTVLSESPDDGTGIPVEIPLLRTFWLAKRENNPIALRWCYNKHGKVKTETVKVTYSNGQTLLVRRPLLEIFAPKRFDEVKSGTVIRGSAICPVTGYTTAVKYVREQLGTRVGGTKDARMIAIRCGDRNYRLPNSSDHKAVNIAVEKYKLKKSQTINGHSFYPDEPTPSNKGHRAVGSPWIYGMRKWEDLFTPRQLLSIGMIRESILEFEPEISHMYESELGIAIITILNLACSRLTDFMSSLCRLNFTGGRGVANTFGRQALQMVWDFLESNPYNHVGANWEACVASAVDTFNRESVIKTQGNALKSQATNIPIPDDSVNCFFTDPPYYDAVPYADLADYFYVWLKRSLCNIHKNLFLDNLTPKENQIVVLHPNSDTERSNFINQMSLALSEGRRVLAHDGIGIVVFAHKSTRGWESQLKAMINSGLNITASWPIDTERGGRWNAQGTASLTSSIHLVCRPREKIVGCQDDIGDWRDVLDELPGRIHEWMPRLASEGVVGADAIFACLGPSLEIFSRYSSVEKASGEKVELKEFLEHVWAAVAREALNMIFEGADASGFEEDARLTAMWLWTLRTSLEGDDEDDDSKKQITKIRGYDLEYDAARKIAQGLGAHLENLKHLVEIKGDTATLLSASARTKYLFGKDAREAPIKKIKEISPQKEFAFMKELRRLEEESTEWRGDFVAREKLTILDQLHQAMILFGSGRSDALKRFLIDEGIGRNPLYWRLAQSLSALYPSGSEEKRWVDGVLARKKGLGF